MDADALNLIAKHGLNLPLNRIWIMTPHPGEAARLAGVSIENIQANRVQAALELAQRFQACVVLKGAGTVVATPQGGHFINPTGNPGLATAGSGDVLSGMIASLLAQGLAAQEAAEAGVWLHGLAADRLVRKNIGPIGLCAAEIIDEARLIRNELYALG